MGLLDDYEQIMARFAPSAADTKAANNQALMALGFGLLGGRKGNEFATIGRAGLGAMDYKQQALANLQAQRQAQMQNFLGIAKMDQALQQQKAQEAIAQRAAGIFSGGPTFDMSNGKGPTPENAATIQQPDRRSQYLQLADLYAQSGNEKAATAYLEAADKLRPKYSATPHTVMVNGVPTLVQTSETELPRTLSGMAPKPDIKEITDNQRKWFADPLTGQRFGADIPIQMSFADKNAAARLQLEKNADQRAAANADSGRWVNDLERGIQVNSQTGESRPITADGKPIGGKAPKNTDPQLQAQGYHERMVKASKVIDKAEEAGYTPSFGSAYAEGLSQLPVIGGTAGGIANLIGQGVNKNMGPYKQAQRDWVRAKLRKESGAVIGPKEEAEEIATYFPQPGDSDAVIKQKSVARKTAERAMAVQARFSGDTGNDDPLNLR